MTIYRRWLLHLVRFSILAAGDAAFSRPETTAGKNLRWDKLYLCQAFSNGTVENEQDSNCIGVGWNNHFTA